MLGIFRSLIAFFAVFVVFVAAAPSPTTNAERFKRGLGPIKPKSLYNPTRRQGGSNPLSSNAPPVKAVIRAYDISDPSNPSFYGYVTADGDGGFTVTQDASHATVIQAQLASLQPGNLAFVSPPYNGYPELGFAGPYNDIGSGSASIVYMAGTQSTTKKSPPISTPNQSFASGSSEPTESAVWYLVNAATLEVHPQWINGNGGSPTTYLIYLTQLHYFVITGDPNTVRSVYGTYGPNIVMRFNLDTVNVPP